MLQSSAPILGSRSWLRSQALPLGLRCGPGTLFLGQSPHCPAAASQLPRGRRAHGRSRACPQIAMPDKQATLEPSEAQPVPARAAGPSTLAAPHQSSEAQGPAHQATQPQAACLHTGKERDESAPHISVSQAPQQNLSPKYSS